jgi:hypothetical protein
VSAWAQARFGDLWPQVRQSVADALQEAVTNAQDAQTAGSSPTRYPFGATLFARKYETLAAAMADVEGVRLVKPKGSPFPLVLFNGCLLLPFRYAQDSRTSIGEARISNRHVSDRMRGLFDKFAPQRYHQGTLFGIGAESDEEDDNDVLGPALEQLPADTLLILIPFACNEKAGLLNAWWGEAGLADKNGHLLWVSPPEKLALPTAPADNRRPATVTGPAETVARFDSAELPDIATTLRPKGQTSQEDDQSSERSEAADDEQE